MSAVPSGERKGPLVGLRVIELVGLGPGPFAAMLLADLGAEVLRIDRIDRVSRADASTQPEQITHMREHDLLARGRPSVGVDLKEPQGVALVLQLIARSDMLIEGFRPGVMERLGLGPDVCLAQDPRLIYGRMTGWGQTGPLRDRAGHDIDYIALSGALHAIGRAGQAPVPPLNLVGDFGGGALLLAFGMLCAAFERARTGLGQVVDAAMIDGAALLMTMFHGFSAAGLQQPERGRNLLDGGAPFYDSYETCDGQHMAVGALEPQFYAQLLQGLGLANEALPQQMDRAGWPLLRQRFASVFKQQTRAHWQAVFDHTDACVAPVLSLHEAIEHPHARARDGYIHVAGVAQPAPAPRFSRTPAGVPAPPSLPGADTAGALRAWGVDAAEIAALRERGIIANLP